MIRYENYIDSQIPWVKEIPSHWRVLRGKNVLTLLSRPAKKDDEIITCFRDGEVTLRKNRREEGFTVSLQEIGYQGIEPGDLVVHGMDGFAGAIGISDSRGKSTPVLNVMDSSQNKRFLMYYLRAAAYRDVFMSLSTGIRVRSCDLRWNKLSVLPFVLPTIEEQKCIVAYLDKKLTEIDSIIAEAKSSIERHTEWKAAIIYEAITKGINPDAEMKDSGVPWIGFIPINWETCKLKHLTVKIGSGKTPLGGAEVYTTHGVLFLRSQNIYNTGLEIQNAYFISDDIDATMENSRVQYKDVLLNITGGSIGRCCIYDLKGVSANVNQHVCILRTNKYKLLPEFLRYFWISATGPMVVAQYQTGGNRQGLNYEQIGATKIPYCDLGTQQKIIEYLDTKCNEIDALISDHCSVIQDLESYKKSMVFEVVTGKRKVC